MRLDRPPLKYGTLLLGSALFFGCHRCTRDGAPCATGTCGKPTCAVAALDRGRCPTCGQPAPACGSCTSCGPTVAPTAPAPVVKPANPAPSAPAALPVPTGPARPLPGGSPSPAVRDNKIPKVIIESIEGAAPSAPVDTKVPKVTILSIEGAAPVAEPYLSPITYRVPATPPTPAAPPAAREQSRPTPAPATPVVGRSREGDPTVHPKFAHAVDYSWLVGELRYIPEENAWMVRFAPANDPVNTVKLVAPGPMSGLTGGQLVQVVGSMVPVTPGKKPEYRVRGIVAVNDKP